MSEQFHFIMILPQVVATKTRGKYKSFLDFCQICKTNYHYATLGGNGLIPLLVDKIVFVFQLVVFISCFITVEIKVLIYCYKALLFCKYFIMFGETTISMEQQKSGNGIYLVFCQIARNF